MQKAFLPRLRVLHAAPGAPPVQVDDIARDLEFGEFSQYVTIRAGSVPITVRPAGGGEPLFEGVIILDEGDQFTGAIISQDGNIEFQLIPEPRQDRERWLSYLRFVHLSPNAPNVDVTFENGTPLFRNVGYREFTRYRAVDPDIYTLQLREAGTDNVLLTITDVWALSLNQISLYAVGLAGGEPSLQVLQVVDDPHGSD